MSCDAIDIVVGHDGDGLALGDGFHQAFHGYPGVRQQPRIRQVAQGGLDQRRHVAAERADAASQHAGRKRRESGTEGATIGGVATRALAKFDQGAWLVRGRRTPVCGIVAIFPQGDSMQLSLDQRPDANIITALGEDGLRIREQRYTASLLVSAETIVENWPVTGAATLRAQDWNEVLALEPELVLFGSGPRIEFPGAEALAPLLERGIGVEVMDTPAACRTYNLLLTEGRRVVAALLLG